MFAKHCLKHSAPFKKKLLHDIMQEFKRQQTCNNNNNNNNNNKTLGSFQEVTTVVSI
jgi:hypothetical protein